MKESPPSSPESGKSIAKDYSAPKGSEAEFTTTLGGEKLAYRAKADWIVLRKEEKPKAEMFFTAYTAGEAGNRPVTFVFNGGPGASSVYLHMGAMGPRRVGLDEEGLPAAGAQRLLDNTDTWLTFTDLVFVDPIGTGLSRMIEQDQPAEKKEGKEDGTQPPSEYWRIKRDLEAIGEFVRTWLSLHHRWESPIYIAGESYGGYRVGKLSKLLQKEYGVGLSGAVIISPALDFGLLDGTDYNVLPWIDVVPSMAAAALSHGLARKARAGESAMEYALRARDFAIRELMPLLATGLMTGTQKRSRILNQLADFIGLPRDVVIRKRGRIDITFFAKNLLREAGRHIGLYDASMALTDPFPSRDDLDAPDPTLNLLERAFASAINTQLRRHIGLVTDRDYELLNIKVNTAWKNDEQKHVLQSQFNAIDDLRYGISLNHHMGVFITHGIFDLVTAFSSSDRLVALMQLTGEQRENLTVRHYPGGHMFYTRASSRAALTEDMRAFYARFSG